MTDQPDPIQTRLDALETQLAQANTTIADLQRTQKKQKRYTTWAIGIAIIVILNAQLDTLLLGLGIILALAGLNWLIKTTFFFDLDPTDSNKPPLHLDPQQPHDKPMHYSSRDR